MPQEFIRPDELWQTLGLAGGQTVIHLGCGAGFYLIPAAIRVGTTGKAIGIDVLPAMLSEMEGRAKREGIEQAVRAIRANIENDRGSTLEDGIADWVLIANILHQSDPQAILKEAARVVNPTGRVVVIGWDTAASPLGPPVHKRIPKGIVVDIAGQAGLHVVKEFEPSPYHYGLILVRT